MTREDEIRRNLEMLKPRGLSGLLLTAEDARSPVLHKIVQALREEQEQMREHLEHPQNIESTTLLRGKLQLVKEILARADEAGPESRQSEPEVWPESAIRPEWPGHA